MYHKDLLRRFDGDIKKAQAYANGTGFSIDDMDRTCRDAAARARGVRQAFHKLGR